MVEGTQENASASEIDMVYFGNPILDVIVNDQDKVLLNKYGLQVADATLATEE